MNQLVSRDDLMRQARGMPASQATSIEQSRAVAEVQAAFAMAAHRPRDEMFALEMAKQSCRMMSVAEQAFYKFSRGGSSVRGETIHLARELARCWGNITYSVMELARDDAKAESEMMAFAIDLQTNASCRLSFIVPHKRDKRGGAEVLTDLRDIYENNMNQGARRLRECIFAVLPRWLIDAAADECMQTLKGGEDQRPLPVRLAEMVEAFAALGVGKDRIEAKVGQIANLTALDLANLTISYRSIKRGEVSAEDEFPRVAHEEAAEGLREMKAQQGKRDAATGTAQPAPKADEKDGAAPTPTAEPQFMDYEEAVATLGMAETVIDLNSAKERLSGFTWSLDEQAGIDEAYNDRLRELKKPRR